MSWNDDDDVDDDDCDDDDVDDDDCDDENYDDDLVLLSLCFNCDLPFHCASSSSSSSSAQSFNHNHRRFSLQRSSPQCTMSPRAGQGCSPSSTRPSTPPMPTCTKWPTTV